MIADLETAIRRGEYAQALELSDAVRDCNEALPWRLYLALLLGQRGVARRLLTGLDFSEPWRHNWNISGGPNEAPEPTGTGRLAKLLRAEHLVSNDRLAEAHTIFSELAEDCVSPWGREEIQIELGRLATAPAVQDAATRADLLRDVERVARVMPGCYHADLALRLLLVAARACRWCGDLRQSSVHLRGAWSEVMRTADTLNPLAAALWINQNRSLWEELQYVDFLGEDELLAVQHALSRADDVRSAVDQRFRGPASSNVGFDGVSVRFLAIRDHALYVQLHEDTQVWVGRLAASPADIWSIVRGLLADLHDADGDESRMRLAYQRGLVSTAAQLSRVLLRSPIHWLQGEGPTHLGAWLHAQPEGRTCVILPAGALREFPLGMLPLIDDDGPRWGEHLALYSVPSWPPRLDHDTWHTNRPCRSILVHAGSNVPLPRANLRAFASGLCQEGHATTLIDTRVLDVLARDGDAALLVAHGRHDAEAIEDSCIGPLPGHGGVTLSELLQGGICLDRRPELYLAACSAGFPGRRHLVVDFLCTAYGFLARGASMIIGSTLPLPANSAKLLARVLSIRLRERIPPHAALRLVVREQAQMFRCGTASDPSEWGLLFAIGS